MRSQTHSKMSLQQLKRLLNPPQSPEDWKEWTMTYLSVVSPSLFTPQPILIRAVSTENLTTYHVRRNSRNHYLALSPNIVEQTQGFFLSADGSYHYSKVKIERPIKTAEKGKTIDRTMEILPYPHPEEEVAIKGQHIIATMLRKTGYHHWDALSEQEKRRLVSLGFTPQHIVMALQKSPPEQLQLSLELLLKDELNPQDGQIFEELLQNLEPPPPFKCLGWILQHPSWSHCSYLLTFSQRLIANYPRELTTYTEHPDPALRLRLAQLHPKTINLAKWYAHESDPNVRLSILNMLHRYANLQNIVDSLTKASDPAESKSLCQIFLAWKKDEKFDPKELIEHFTKLKLSKKRKRQLSDRLYELKALSWAHHAWHRLWYS